MTVYLNGQFLPLADAKIPVLDRGFIYGDGVYELIPVYQRTPFRMTQHLARLQRSLDGIRLPNPHAATEWASIIGELIARQSFADQGVYLQVTRGVAKRDHAFPQGVPPTVFMMSNPLATPTTEQVERGVAAVTAEDNRWRRCDLKTISLVGNVLMRQLAADAGAVETVMFRDGWLTEASASNVLVVIGGTNRRAAEGQPDPSGHHLRRGRRVRARGGAAVRHAARGESGSARRRRDVAILVDERSARGDDTRRAAVCERRARPDVPHDARAVPAAQAGR